VEEKNTRSIQFVTAEETILRYKEENLNPVV